jgi:hypothetical protein
MHLVAQTFRYSARASKVEARALYLKHVLVADRMVAATHCCFVCPMQKRIILPRRDASFRIFSEFKECMRDPVITGASHMLLRIQLQQHQAPVYPHPQLYIPIGTTKALPSASGAAPKQLRPHAPEPRPRLLLDVAQLMMIPFDCSCVRP